VPKDFPFVWSTSFPISSQEMALIWEPYLLRLAAAYLQLLELDVPVAPGIRPLRLPELVAQAGRAALPSSVRGLFSSVRRASGRRKRSRLPSADSPSA
jgi:hypothetical protein